MAFARLGLEMKGKYLGYLSSNVVDPTSRFTMVRVKGEADRDMGLVGYPIYTAFRPGFLVNRDNDFRLIETIGKWLPFVPKIESKNLARCMLEHCLRTLSEHQVGDEPKKIILKNKQMNAYVATL